MHPQLDLQRAIRPGLDLLANEIVIALKKRSRFRHNPEIYRPGLVRSDPGIALLRYELAKVERAHAELGRYAYASQESFTDVSDVAPVIARPPPENPIDPVPSGMGERVIEFYLDWVARTCPPGSDSDTWGETVTADVNALLAILERVSLGKLVAESKLAEDPERFRATGGRREALLELIVKRDREAEVLELARRLAEHYELDPAAAESVFRWMIGATVDIEIEYLRRRLALG